MQAAEITGREFETFLQNRPEKDGRQYHVRENGIHAFLERQHHDDGKHAEKKGLADEALRFRMLPVFAQPEPEPEESRQNATQERVENGLEVHPVRNKRNL